MSTMGSPSSTICEPCDSRSPEAKRPRHSPVQIINGAQQFDDHFAGPAIRSGLGATAANREEKHASTMLETLLLIIALSIGLLLVVLPSSITATLLVGSTEYRSPHLRVDSLNFYGGAGPVTFTPPEGADASPLPPPIASALFSLVAYRPDRSGGGGSGGTVAIAAANATPATTTPTSAQNHHVL